MAATVRSARIETSCPALNEPSSKPIDSPIASDPPVPPVKKQDRVNDEHFVR